MSKTAQQLADKIIKELHEAGLSYDQMLTVIRIAREKFEKMKNDK